jgi:hypothetical protein
MSLENLSTHDLNSFWNDQSRNDEMIESFVNDIRTSSIEGLFLCHPPPDEEFGRRVAQALTSNNHIKFFWIRKPHSRVVWRDLLQWVTLSTAGETPTASLASWTNLDQLCVDLADHDMSVEDWDLMFRLLLTSTSIQQLIFIAKCQFHGDDGLSEAAFVSLCDGLASSQLRYFRLAGKPAHEAYLGTAAESLARAIAESPLEEVTICGFSLVWSALSHTAPVRNFDFALSSDVFGDDDGRMKVNRKWKPLLTANVPLALWPQILEKAHSSPETSHGPAGILFYLLREKPDLVNLGR